MSDAVSDIVWTPARGENEPELRSISWNNLLLSDEVYGGKFLTSAEVRINPETALQSTVFLACCRIISETVAGLPLLVYRRLKSGNEEVASDIPLSHVLGFAPNAWQSKFEFFEQMVMALTCWGNSYSEVKSGRYGAVTELNNLHPSRMRVERLENGRLKYSYNDPQTGRLMQYTQDQIMHVRWTPEPDGVKGMVPVEVSRDAIALSRACEIYASKFWANMGRPGVVLQTDGAISAETAERLRDNWERIHRGVQNSYKTAVLTNGLKVESFGANNSDSQFLEVRKFQCEEIARCFRLPLSLIQGQSPGGSLEVQGQEFINWTLMPWLIRIEQSISRSLIYDDETYYAKFDTRGLLRGDSGSRASYYSTMMNLGVLSINDVRRMEGLGSIGKEADTHLVAMNLQPLEEAVKPKPDPSMMPGFGSGAPAAAPGGPPSLPEVKPGKAPIASPSGEVSVKKVEQKQARAEARELSPQDEKLEEAQQEIAEEDGKWSKESAHYIASNPFAGRGIKCHNCTHYVEEGGCKVVSGPIAGDAICKLWVIPQEKIAEEPEKRDADCGANGPGGGGFQEGNKCGGEGGEGSASSRIAAGEKPSKVLQSLGFRKMNFSDIDKMLEKADDKQKARILDDLDSVSAAIKVDPGLASVPIRIGPIKEIYKNRPEALKEAEEMTAGGGVLRANADLYDLAINVFTDDDPDHEYESGWNSSDAKEAVLVHEHSHIKHFRDMREAFPHPGEDELPGVDPVWYAQVMAESAVTKMLEKDKPLREKVRGISEYATTDAFEFVAEYSTAVTLGEMKNDPDLDRLCRAAGATPPKRAKK
jgi:HK97 family phage portal protein